MRPRRRRRRPVTLVPKSAVRDRERQPATCSSSRQDTVERRAVQTGGTDGDRLEVTAGLTGGDRVVVSPPPTLAEGVPIVIK